MHLHEETMESTTIEKELERRIYKEMVEIRSDKQEIISSLSGEDLEWAQSMEELIKQPKHEDAELISDDDAEEHGYEYGDECYMCEIPMPENYYEEDPE